MKPTLSIALTVLGGTLVLGACTHVPPGQSVEYALAKKPDLVKLPPATPAPNPLAPGGNVPAVEPSLPMADTKVERVGDAYSRGMFCLETGSNEGAIAAFEEAVKIDPTFSDAWQNLALLYEKTGQSKKALEAFKKAKQIARH